MNDDLGLLAGCLLVFLVCAWAVYHLAERVGHSFRSGITVDRTLGEVDKDHVPGMFWLQTVGNVLLLVASAFIGIGALLAILVRFVA